MQRWGQNEATASLQNNLAGSQGSLSRTGSPEFMTTIGTGVSSTKQSGCEVSHTQFYILFFLPQSLNKSL